MDMTRRRFLRVAALALSTALCIASRWCVHVARAGVYPGPVVPLDPAAVRQPGKWAG